MDVAALALHDQFIHCLVSPKDYKEEFLCTFVHPQNTVSARANLWKELVKLSGSISIPWVVLGDFNVVLDATEKVSETGSSSHVTTELSDMLVSTGLTDHSFIGQKFTWDNNHTFCKLDRVLVNDIWSTNILETVVDFLPRGVYDHSPILVRMFKPVFKHFPRFKFKNFWAEESDFLQLVKTFWEKPVGGCFMYQFTQHLNDLKIGLKRLKKSRFSNLDT